MPPDYAAVAEAAGSVGAFALIAWVLRRVFTHTIPRLADSFEKALTRAESAFQEQLKEQQHLFHEELSKCREDFRQELLEQRKDFKEQIRYERETFLTRIDRMAQALTDLEKAIHSSLTNRG